MAICLSLEERKDARARAREQPLRSGAQDGGTVNHADKTSLNRSTLVRPYVARAVRDRHPVITKSVALCWNVGNVSAKPTTRKRH